MATTTQITVPPRNTSPLALWHLLSLDAPTVAALWTCFIARATHTPLPLALPAAMFLAVWILYATDRLLDTRQLGSMTRRHGVNELEARHLFHFHHRRVFVAIMPLTAVGVTALLPTLLTATIHLYIVEGILLIGWFLLVHTIQLHLPKEFVVGLYFATATFTPTLVRRPPHMNELLLNAALFATLCTLNCLFIHAWEHNLCSSHPQLTSAAALLCVLSVASVFKTPKPAALIPAGCALAAVFLLVLNGLRNRFSRTHLRATADLALLTPALIFPFLR